MKAKELRVGNYYDDNGIARLVTPNVILEVFESERQCCKPIPLTKEWLLNLKAKYSGSIYFISLTNLKAEIHFEVYPKEIVSIIRSDFCELILDEIKYVHQLQNLFFALTGEELTQTN
jgi:hypothetical protein